MDSLNAASILPNSLWLDGRAGGRNSFTVDFDSIKEWLGVQAKKQSRHYTVRGWIGIALCPVALMVATSLIWGFLTVISQRRGNPVMGDGMRWAISLLCIGLMFLGNRLISTKDMVSGYCTGDPVDRALMRWGPQRNLVWFVILLWILFAGPRLLDWGRDSLRLANEWRDLDTHSCAAVLIVLFVHPRRVAMEDVQREIPWLNLDETLPHLVKIPGLLQLTGPPAGLGLSDELRKSIRTGGELEPAAEPVQLE